jgi:hypothetical protein
VPSNLISQFMEYFLRRASCLALPDFLVNQIIAFLGLGDVVFGEVRVPSLDSDTRNFYFIKIAVENFIRNDTFEACLYVEKFRGSSLDYQWFVKVCGVEV